MKKLKFALIGCGRISYKHVDALQKNEHAEITGFCDIKPERAKKYADQFGVPYFNDYREMLRVIDADIVNVLTPSGNHAEIAIDVMRSCRHVIVEKPMALTVADCDRMIHEADYCGKRLFVVKQNRFNSSVLKTREAFNSNRFGKLVMGTVRVRWSRNQAYYDQDDWRGKWATDGGVFSNQASHHIDLLQWFFGDVESVMATTRTSLVKIEAEDTGAAILEFTNGSIGIVEATTATRPKDLEGSISILGEKGTVVIGGFAVNQIQAWNFTEPTEEDKIIVDQYKDLPPNVYGFGHEAYFRHVINSLKTGNSALVEGLEGKKSVEIINAIYESAFTGKKVYIHNQYRNSPLGR